MKITITIETSDNGSPSIEASPQGSEALIEHADHDSTPRVLGFNPQPPLEEE